jgi:hypothetical protein
MIKMTAKDFYGMTLKQKNMIQILFFEREKTYHKLADEAGVGPHPDKFDDLSYFDAQKIIDFHLGTE